MAVTKNFNVSTSNANISGYVAIVESDVSTSGNHSDVTATLYLRRTNIYSGITASSNSNFYITIDGTKYTIVNNGYVEIPANSTSGGGSYTKIGSATKKDIAHGASDGKKNITVSVEGSMPYSGPITLSKQSTSLDLTQIPRYGTSNQSFNSKTSTSIKMNWSSDNTVDYLWYSTNNGSSWTGVDVSDGTSGTYNITGLSPNTTYNIKTRIRRKDSQLTTDSSALSVTTHPKTTASISFSSKTEVSITVTSSCSITASSTKYRIKKSGGSYGSWQTSGTFNGLSPNTTYYVQVEKVGSVNGEAGYAETSAITTYNYPYCETAPDFTVGNKVKLTFYNPLSRSIQIQMWSHKSQAFVSELITLSGTTYEGFNDVANRLYASIPENTESKYNIDVHYSGNKAVKEGGKYSIDTSINKPNFSNFEYSTNLSELTGNNDTIIDDKTTTTFTISENDKATGINSSYIKKYRIECGTQQFTVDYSESVITKEITNCRSTSLKITAIDSRGQEKTVTKNVSNFKSYTNPFFVSNEAERKNGIDAETYLNSKINFWNSDFGNGTNKITSMSYRTKTKGSSEYGEWFDIDISKLEYDNNEIELKDFLIHNNGSSGGFTIGVSYDVQLKITDGIDTYAFTTITSNSINLTDGKVGFSLLKDNNGNYHMGIDGMPSLSSPLTISQKTLADLIYPVGSIYMSINATDPKTLFGGTWERLKDRFLLGAGDSYSAGGTGGSASTTLATANLPSHNHSFSGSSGNQSASHTHQVGGHSHGLNSHKHSFTTGENNASHSHSIWGSQSFASGTTNGWRAVKSGDSSNADYNSWTNTGNQSANHKHTGTTDAASGSTANSSAFNTGNQSASHNHSISGTIGNTGSGTSFTNMPPYLTVYIWKRTA